MIIQIFFGTLLDLKNIKDLVLWKSLFTNDMSFSAFCEYDFLISTYGLSIGCKIETWEFWDHFFFSSSAEYETSRESVDFALIKASYVAVRDIFKNELITAKKGD